MLKEDCLIKPARNSKTQNNVSFSNQKVPGSPLFCQDYNGVYGLAGIHWGMAYAGEQGYLKDKGPKISKAIFLGFNSFNKTTTKKCPNIKPSL